MSNEKRIVNGGSMKICIPPTHEVMDYNGLSAYLKVAQGTLRHWVMKGKIPCIKIGRNVRFSKKQIDGWLEEQSQEWRGAQETNTDSTGLEQELFRSDELIGETI